MPSVPGCAPAPFARLAGILLASLACACASTPTALESVSDISAQLVSAAELRSDPSLMLVCVGEIVQTLPERNIKNLKRSAQRAGDPTSVELEQLFALALSRRLNVVETTRAKGELYGLDEQSRRKVAEEHHASHLLVGDYVVLGDEVVVSVRLVDVENAFIIAGAQGAVSLRMLSNQVQSQHDVGGSGIFGWFNVSSGAEAFSEPETAAGPDEVGGAAELDRYAFEAEAPDEVAELAPEIDPPLAPGAGPRVTYGSTLVLGEPMPFDATLAPRPRVGEPRAASAKKLEPELEREPSPYGPAGQRVLGILRGKTP